MELFKMLLFLMISSIALAHQGHDAPFAGSDPQKWRTAEAHTANWIKYELDTSWKKPGIKDVIASVPTQMLEGGYSPFPDPQTNASIAFGTSNKKYPPLVAIKEIYKNGQSQYRVSFAKDLQATSSPNVQAIDDKLIIKHPYINKYFIVSFAIKNVFLPLKDFMAGLPRHIYDFGQGRTLPDPENIAKKSVEIGMPAHKVLESMDLSQRYGGPWYNDRVHGEYPNKDDSRTAVGGVTTWMVNNEKPFKQLYTCFDGRDLQAEIQNGVPSGAGWHKVGLDVSRKNAAETIVNNLEKLPILSAYSVKSPGYPQFDRAYGLNDIIIARYLQPQEVFVTLGNQFHWYAVTVPQKVCVQIWVHPNLPTPTNNWGF